MRHRKVLAKRPAWPHGPAILTAFLESEGWSIWPLLMRIATCAGPYGVVGFSAGERPGTALGGDEAGSDDRACR